MNKYIQIRNVRKCTHCLRNRLTVAVSTADHLPVEVEVALPTTVPHGQTLRTAHGTTYIGPSSLLIISTIHLQGRESQGDHTGGSRKGITEWDHGRGSQLEITGAGS